MIVRPEPLAALLAALDERGYAFVVPTNAAYRIVVAREDKRRAKSVRDVLGWSLPYAPGSVDAEIERLLQDAGVVADAPGGRHQSLIRVARLNGRLFIHSAYPPSARDAVFLGPDSYRFADFIERSIGAGRYARVLDVGVGGVVAGSAAEAVHVHLTDVNPVALQLAAVNARHAGVSIQVAHGDGLAGVEGPLDLLVANPPFIAGHTGRTYSEGGDMLGARLSYDWAVAAMERLAPGGCMLLYTGAAITDGHDRLRERLGEAARVRGCTLAYRELDPDIFTSELNKPVYQPVDRIAAVGAVITRRPTRSRAQP